MIQVFLESGQERRKLVALVTEQLGDDFLNRCKLAETILLKVNLVHHEKQLASTHVDAVRGVLDVVRPKTKAKIIIGDAGYHGTKAAFRNFGYERILEEYQNIELIDLNDDTWVDGYSILADGSKNPIRLSKIASQASLKISLANLKTHRDFGVSLAVENWVLGTWLVPSRVSANGLVWAHWPWLQEQGSEAVAKTISEIYRQLPCDVAIIDGMMGMEGEGPTEGKAVPMNVALAGNDALAVDAVACALMSIDPSEIGYLKSASGASLGIIDLGKIDVPPALLSQLARHFVHSSNL